MFTLKRLLPLLLLSAACAQVGAPPGGPPDKVPPILLSRYPDTLEVLPGFMGQKGWAEFRFDEVIKDEGSNFQRLVLISPDTMLPKIEWGRDRIRVQPRKGWKPNTVYRIELAPGIVDLRDNATKTSQVITLYTGGEVPTRFVIVRAIDWLTRNAIPGALVEAITVADSQVYRAIADSTGRLSPPDSIHHVLGFGPLPNKEMWIRVVQDRNNNHRLDYGEPWDTVRVAPGQNSAGEIWVFSRDTTPAKFVSASRKDSVTIVVDLDHPIDPNLLLTADSVQVLVFVKTDSTSVGPISAIPMARYDSLQKLRAPVKVDSGTPPVLPPVATPTVNPDLPYSNKPIIGTRIVIQTQGQLPWESRFKIVLHGVRTLNGVVGTVFGVLNTLKEPAKPAPAKPDSLSKADSLAGGRGGRGGGGTGGAGG